MKRMFLATLLLLLLVIPNMQTQLGSSQIVSNPITDSPIGRAVSIDHYPDYSEIKGTLMSLCNSTDYLTYHDLGYDSWEGRDLFAVEISDDGSSDSEPKALIMGDHHGDEGVSAVVPYYFVMYIRDSYNQSQEVRTLVEDVDTWVVPMVNPDGYMHDTRKNRRPNGDGTYGVDLNRNYWYHWGNNAGTETWENTYHGPYPFSEPETKAIRDLATAVHFNLSVSFHSYGGIFVHPWGYSYYEKAPDSELMDNMARYGASFLDYQWGQSSDPNIGMYTADGDSDDWLYGNESTLSFTVEIGKSSKEPPASELQGICESHTEMLMNFIPLAKDPYSAMYYGVEGFVYDKELNPIANATVYAHGQVFSRSTTTDSEGRFKIPLLKGEYTLEVTAAGYNDYSDNITVDGSEYLVRYVTLTSPNPPQVVNITIKGMTVRAGDAVLSDGDSVDAGSVLKVECTFTPQWDNITADLVLDGNDKGRFPMSYAGGGTYSVTFSTEGMSPGNYTLDVTYRAAGKNYTDGYRPGPDFTFRLVNRAEHSVSVLFVSTLEQSAQCAVCNLSSNPIITIRAEVEGSPTAVWMLIYDSNGEIVANITMSGSGGEYLYALNTSGLGVGEYNIEVRAVGPNGSMDTDGSNASGPDLSIKVIPGCKAEINEPPVFYGMKVEPESGDVDTEFTVSIYYSDNNGDEPSYAYLYINTQSEIVDIQQVDDTTWQIKYTGKLPEGENKLKFVASDGENSIESQEIKVEVRGRNPFSTNANPEGSVNVVAVGAIVSLVVMVIVFLFYAKHRKNMRM